MAIRSKTWNVVLGGVALALGAACGGGTGPNGGGPPGAITVNLTLANEFSSNRNSTANPAVDTLAAGGTVTWKWATGAGLHSILSDGPNSFIDLPSSSNKTSGTYVQVLGATGTYNYHCTEHGTVSTGMRGTVVVK